MSVAEDSSRETTIRLRIKRLPGAGEMDEYDLRRFRVGDIYDVAARLGSILILGGYAEPVSDASQAVSAAYSDRRRNS
jgi:hypothetical protein